MVGVGEVLLGAGAGLEPAADPLGAGAGLEPAAEPWLQGRNPGVAPVVEPLGAEPEAPEVVPGAEPAGVGAL